MKDWSGRTRCEVATFELTKSICGAIWCGQLESFLELCASFSQPLHFVLESALVRLWRGILA
jgi:hypothetical protein